MGNDFLINYLSSKTFIAMKDFKEIISTNKYNLNEFDKYSHINILKQLQALGFCDTNPEGDKIFTCEPEFVMIYSETYLKVILVGARDESLISKIKNSVEKRKERVKLRIENQEDIYTGIKMPELIEITAIYQNDIREIATECRIKFAIKQPALFSTLRYSIPLFYYDDLVFKETKELDWEKRIFSVKELCFSREKSKIELNNVLIEYSNLCNNRPYYLIWKDGNAAEINVEWGRYFILNQHKKNILYYNKAKKCLYVPLTVPLPTILARSVTMCSGIVALKEKNFYMDKDYLAYQKVPEFLAIRIAKKLGQRLNIYTRSPSRIMQ